jgi:hypothetical protein
MINLQKGEYMNVERVAEWVEKHTLRKDHKITAPIYGGGYYDTSDLKSIFPNRMFREMECEVITYMVDVR